MNHRDTENGLKQHGDQAAVRAGPVPRARRFTDRLAAAGLLCVSVIVTGCAGVWERYDADGQLVSRTAIAWSISPRIVESTPTGASVLVSDTAESLRAAGDLVGTAAATAAREAVTP
jgi:hypothetical protein